MLVDMHIHTRFSPCSIIKIPKLLEKAKQTGMDGICITDHDTIAAKSIIENGVDSSGICVIVGTEYTTTKGDFLIFGPVESIPKRMGAEDLFKWVEKEGAVIIPAHPFRRERPADLHILQSCKIIEVLNGRNNHFENELCRDWLKKQGNNVKEVGGSDAHTLGEVGQIVTQFEKNIYCLDDFIRELQHGNYSPVLRNHIYSESKK